MYGKNKEIKVDFKYPPFQIIQMFVFIDLMRGLLMASGFPSHLAHGSYIMTWQKILTSEANICSSSTHLTLRSTE